MNEPIFISGLSGTGKTQLRLALEADHRLVVFRKTYLWTTVRGRFGDLSRPDQVEAALAAIEAAEGSTPSLDQAGKLEGPHPYEQLFAVHYRQRADAQGIGRWGVQMGGLEHFADDILGAFPEARFVHLVADPGDHLASHRNRRRWNSMRVEAHRWLDSARVAIDHASNDRWMTVRTPDLVQDPVGVVGEVARFLEVAAPGAGIAEIDFDQLTQHGRAAGRHRLPSEVQRAANALGFGGEAGRKSAVGLRRESREGRSA